MRLITKLFNFVLTISAKHNIDESHGVSHSMNILNYANRIFEDEVVKKPWIKPHERIIYTSAILHDMCDKKYMNESEGVREMEAFLSSKIPRKEIEIVSKIVTTMSYSTVKKKGFPDLGIYQSAYHIVREADLLTAYDFDRAMIYNIRLTGGDIEKAYQNAKAIFIERVLRHNEDGLFFTDFSRKESLVLYTRALERMWVWKRLFDRL
jgi:HD superfamily phosphodiesterase